MAKDIVLPDSIYNLFLKPIARRLKVKHISPKSSTLALAIFRAIAKRSKDFSIKLTGHKDTLDEFLSTITAIFRMGSSLLQPLFAIIPPQYVLIILAILLVPTAIIPMQVIGAFLLYQAEQNIKYPFKNMSKYRIEQTQGYIRENKFIIEKVILRQLDANLKEWWLLPNEHKLNYFYKRYPRTLAEQENRINFNTLTGYFPNQAVTSWATSDKGFKEYMLEALGEDHYKNVPENIKGLIDNLDWDQILLLEGYFYDGYIRFLPPVMTSIVKVINNYIKLCSGAFEEFNEMYDNAPDWLKPFFGIYQVIFTLV